MRSTSARPHAPGAKVTPRQPRTGAGTATTAGARHRATGAQLERELRRILTASLDALKNPSAIPSQILMAAMVQARQL